MSTLDRFVDDIPQLDNLVRAGELEEMCAAATEACGRPVWVEADADKSFGPRYATAAVRRVITVLADPIAEVCCADARDRAMVDCVARAIEVAAHHACAAKLAGAVHESAIASYVKDLTQSNAHLREALDRAASLDRVKSNLLANVSHEMRTPLTAVMGYTEILLEGMAGPLTTSQAENLRTIQGKSEQLLALITDLLDLASLESQRGPREVQVLPWRETVEQAVATFAQLQERRRLTVDVQIARDLAVAADKAHVRQILHQLVSNAMKFSPHGGVVQISAEREKFGAPWIRTTLLDQGPGIPPEKMASIFEPFFQVDGSSTRMHGGTGLGLTLVKAYVEGHGGKVAVANRGTGGASFTFTLPLGAAKAKASDTVDISADASIGE